MLTDAGANGICFCSVLIIAFHFTNHVCCHAIGLRVTTCPLFCRNFDVARLHSRKRTASTACDLRETMRARRFPRPTAWIRHAFPRKSSCLDPFVCHLCAVPHGRCRSQHMPMYHVRGRFPGVGLVSHLLPRTHGHKRETVRE